MGFAANYFGRHKGFRPYIAEAPSEKLCFTVIIPAFCEPGITGALESLWNCTRPAVHCEIIVVINSPENADPKYYHLTGAAGIKSLNGLIITGMPHFKPESSIFRIPP